MINYPDIVNHVFGKCGKRFVELCLAMIHFQFTIAQLSFCIQGLKHLTEEWSGIKDIEAEYFGVIMLALFSPLAWVREIEFFKVGFIFGFSMIIVTLLTISAFCVSKNSVRDESMDLA